MRTIITTLLLGSFILSSYAAPSNNQLPPNENETQNQNSTGGGTSPIVTSSDSNGAAINFPAGVTSGDVTTPDGCQTVNCTTCSSGFFMPMKSNSEWQAFKSNPPFNVSLSSCLSAGTWTYTGAPLTGSCVAGCMKLQTQVCSTGNPTDCSGSPASRYYPDSSCGTTQSISAGVVCSSSTVTGYRCSGNTYNVGSTILGLSYIGGNTVTGSLTSGSMTTYNESSVSSTTSCATGSPIWQYSAWGACQADCTQTRTRTCVNSVTLLPTTGCTSSPWQSSQACTGGSCVGCTYPTNVPDVGTCMTACPGGPTKMCQTGNNNSSLILCPGSGGSCYCQAGSTCSAYVWDVLNIPCVEDSGSCEMVSRAICRNSSTSAAVNKSNCPSGTPSGIPSGLNLGIPAVGCSPSSTTDCYISSIPCPSNTAACLQAPP